MVQLVRMSRKRQNGDDNYSSDTEEEEENYVRPKKKKSSQTNSIQVKDRVSTIRHCGTIERVVIKNFMCHNHLDFPLGSRINFIQGRNGSGKSAILSAVVIGLGGASRVTNRGNSLKALIKNGKQTATTEITLNNSGPRAFKPEVYGDAVIIERKLHSTGGGGYKIKTQSGKVVSSKKEDLQVMLQHYNLQVDNPVTILNQDMARSFLNSNDPKTLFKFFMRATQLQQMEVEYEHFLFNITRSEDIIKSRRENMPTLKKEVEEWKAKHEYFCNLGSSEEKLRGYRKELAWAKIKTDEVHVEEVQKQLEIQEAALAKVMSKLTKTEGLVTEEKKKSSDLQKEVYEKMSVVQRMDEAAQETNDKLNALMKEKRMIQYNTQVAEKEVRKFSEDAEGINETIRKSQDSTKSTWAAKQAKCLEQVAELQEELEKLEQEKRMVIHHLESLKHTRDTHKQELEQQRLEGKAIKRRIHTGEQDLQAFKQDKNNSFTVFGQWVPHLNREVEKLYRNRHFSAKPVGPLGAYIKLRDKKWAHVAEDIMGKSMTAYCVNSANDAKVLKEVIRRLVPANQPAPHVIVTRFRDHVHNVEAYEVRSDLYPSLWSILEISETVVANTLIDSLQVESVLLIPTSEEAGQLLMDERNVPPNCQRAFTLNGDTYYPDPNFRIYSGDGQRRAKFLQVSVEEKVRDLESDLKASKEEVDRINAEVRNIQDEIRGTENEMGSYAKKEHSLKGKITKIYGTIANLEAHEEPMPPDVNQLEEDLQETESSKRKAQEKVELLKRQVAEISSSLEEIKVNREQHNNELKNEINVVTQLKESLLEGESRSEKCEREQKVLQEKKVQHLAEKKKVEAELEKLNTSLSSVRSEVENRFGARTTSRRKVKDIERDYQALKQRLQQEKASHGEPVEVARKYQEKDALYKCCVAEIEQHSQLIEKLKEGLDRRNGHYYKIRRNIAVMMKYSFNVHMLVRNLKGKISINFEEGTLNIVASKHSSSNHDKEQPKQSLAMMSGGERSFITVCFLLALWDSIDSPLRMLDEFDVFMDNVSRTQSLELMSGAAQMKRDCQFVFLTPLSLPLESSDIVRIHKMPDPERDEENLG